MKCNKEIFDYVIKRGDTRPSIKYSLLYCDETNLNDNNILVSVSMWANSYLGHTVSPNDTVFKLKNNYNISSIGLNNYILIKSYNFFEYVKVTGLSQNELQVSRSQLNSVAASWDKGTQLKIIKILDVEAGKEILYNESIDLNGKVQNTVSSQSLIYDWVEGDTNNPGDYFVEFKVYSASATNSWSRKYPTHEEGIKVQITDNNLEI